MTIEELEDFFEKTTLPKTLIIDRGNKITDVKFYIKNHLQVIKAHPESRATIPFYDRLINLKELLNNE